MHPHPHNVDPFFRLQIIAPTILASGDWLEQSLYDEFSGSVSYQPPTIEQK